MSLSLSRRWLFAGSIMLSVVVLLSGCVYIAVGSLGALGGYVVSPDTVEGVLDGRTKEDVWSAAVEIVSMLGLINEQNEAAGIIVAKIEGAKVTITVIHLSGSSVKLTVKSRKSFLPKIKVAQDVYVKIVNSMEEQ